MIDGTEYFDCDCEAVEHALRLTLDLDEQVIYVDASCCHVRSFRERIAHAWRHIKGSDNHDGGAFHDRILKYSDRQRLADMLVQIVDINGFGQEECKIASDDNRLHFVFDSADDDLPPMLRIETYLSRRSSWLSCVWYALRYVFGRCSKYGTWDCFEIDSEAAATLMYQLNIWHVEYEKFEKVTKLPTPSKTAAG